MNLFILLVVGFVPGLFLIQSPGAVAGKPAGDLDSLKALCAQGDSSACYRVAEILERICNKLYQGDVREKSRCTEEVLSWYTKGLFLQNSSLRTQCLSGDTVACSRFSALIEQSVLSRLQTSEPYFQLYAANLGRCWWNAGFARFILNEVAATKGKNSPEYEQAKIRADLIFTQSDSCRIMGVRF